MNATESVEPQKRTRAARLRESVVIRLALDEAAPEIARILQENGFAIECDKCFPHWFIATVGTEVVGCVQSLPAKPVGYMNFLYVTPKAPFKLRAIAVRKLLIQGMASVYEYGGKYVAAHVPEKFRDVAAKLNFVGSGELMVKQL